MDYRPCLKPPSQGGYSREQLNQLAREKGLDPRNYRTKALLCSALLSQAEMTLSPLGNLSISGTDERKEHDHPLSAEELAEARGVEEPLPPAAVLELLVRAPQVSKLPSQASPIHDLIFSFLPLETPPLCREFSASYVKQHCTPRQPHGVLKTYHSNGTLKTRSEYHNGQLEGISEIWSSVGKLGRRERYHQGVLHGVTELREYGSTIIEMVYDHGILLEKRFTLLDSNGVRRLISKTTYQGDESIREDYNPEGVAYPENRPSETVRFLRGEREGEQLSFYPTGVIQSRVIIEHGIRTLEETFYPTGELESRVVPTDS